MEPWEFASVFQRLTGHPPFPWQQALYHTWFAQGRVPPSCNLPTGLGKTAVIAVWLLALAQGANIPRRLVYVVNRRTVVDQTTAEVENYRNRLRDAGLFEPLRALSVAAAASDDCPLAISTLRGQFADNREWSADPSRPAVICGTVDMIGSRLLFSGYGVGMKAKPLHAGFLGQDTLLIHDEAHLEPAFQKLIEAICEEQTRCCDIRPLHVMELTATSRGTSAAFGLTEADHAHDVVRQRVSAVKRLHLQPLDKDKKVADELAKKAQEFADQNRAVVVFARTVEDVLKIAEKLPKNRVLTLTGTMRGCERDRLVEEPIFQRFLPGGTSDEPTVYLVCTAAGEVGVNISADHLLSDLTPFDSMAQRLGRVNRFGLRSDSEVHVYHPTEFDNDNPYEQACAQTLELLRQLDGDASPAALSRLDTQQRQSAFTPPPTILPVTDILFDAWALTTIREPLPGRPPVEPYLHGLPAEWQPPETQVAWREEVGRITGALLDFYRPADLLEAYPLKPHEWLKEPSYRAFKHFAALAERHPDAPVWLMNDTGSVEVLTLQQIADKNNKERIEGQTVLLAPYVGGLTRQGLLDGRVAAPSEGSLDVADIPGERVRVWSDDDAFEAKTAGMHAVATITFPSADDDADEITWEWFTRRNEGDQSAHRPVLWEIHVADVVRQAERMVTALAMERELAAAIVTAAQFHDHGKKRELFQQILGNNRYPQRWLAKSGQRSTTLPETYRHEFGSLLEAEKELTGEHRDLILHLIAAHHGRARPHFLPDEAFDPERPPTDAQRMATDVPQRFARLQRRYGRWGLAYLESLLRAADWAASANPSEFVDGK